MVEVDATTFTVKRRIALAPDTTTADSNQAGRGLPNYLFSVTLSPDGRVAWIPAKKDNIFRGTLLDTNSLNQDNTVRPLVSVLDLTQGSELVNRRIDLDDRSLPIHVAFSPLGEYGFVTLAGSNMVEIRGIRDGVVVATLNEAGMSPRASLLDPQQRLFIQAALGRNVVVYDLKPLVSEGDSSLAPEQVEQVLAYLQQLDEDLPQPRLPFELPLPDMTAGAGGGGAAAGAAGQTGQPSGGMGSSSAGAPVAPKPKTSSCSAVGVAGGDSSVVAGWLGLSLLGAFFARKRAAG